MVHMIIILAIHYSRRSLQININYIKNHLTITYAYEWLPFIRLIVIPFFLYNLHFPSYLSFFLDLYILQKIIINKVHHSAMFDSNFN